MGAESAGNPPRGIGHSARAAERGRQAQRGADRDTFETLEALGKDSLEGLLVVSYPRVDTNEKFGPGAAAYVEAYRKKYNREPIAPQGMAAYVGARTLFKAIETAKSTDPDKVRAAALTLDEPIGTYETGFGSKFDENAQNIRAFPVTAQWQDGKMVTVFPVEAAPAGGKVFPLARK